MLDDVEGRRGRLPNFFLVGANRAGTTSIHRYLDQHPDVFMSPVKEPNFFHPHVGREKANWPNRGAQVADRTAYEALFAEVRGERAVGEASTVYLSTPETPRLILAEIPDARVVAVLRDPVDRAFSDYMLHRSWGTEPLSFADAVAAELAGNAVAGGRKRYYVGTGFYGRSLSHYYDAFPSDRVRVYLYEDLQSDPDALARDLFAFLGVDPTRPVDTTIRHNASRYEPKHPSVDKLARSASVRSLGRRVLSSSARARVREVLRRTNRVVPVVPDEVRRTLVDLYRDDIALTESLIGRDLAAWTRVP